MSPTTRHLKQEFLLMSTFDLVVRARQQIEGKYQNYPSSMPCLYRDIAQMFGCIIKNIDCLPDKL